MATKKDLHLALGLPDPGDGADEPVDGEETDSEQEENDAIDAVFDTTDPEERREAFRRAVKLCSQSY